jgi:hypothetical protein
VEEDVQSRVGRGKRKEERGKRKEERGKRRRRKLAGWQEENGTKGVQ